MESTSIAGTSMRNRRICRDSDGSNALTILCQFYEKENVIEIIKLLIQCGIDVNCTDSDGSNAFTLLCEKYENGLIEIMDLLIQSGFDVTPETCTFFQINYHKENRDEILQLLDQQHPDQPLAKRMKFE
jgi:hypothetical protein